MSLMIATCYFPVSASIPKNLRYVLAQMRKAKRLGAEVTHFPEACLSGYAGADFASYRGFDWGGLEVATQVVLREAKQLKQWVVLGSSHRLSGNHKPHNSCYIINPRGEIVDRYDKIFCAGDRSGKTGDLAHYTPGNHFTVFTIQGIRCGVLICHDFRYPELYREYKRRGVQLMFHSYHAGHLSPARFKKISDEVGRKFHSLNRATTLPGILMPATMQSMAANNYLWISCSNTSARRSCWPSFLVRPDGVITGRLRLHSTSLLLTKVNPNQKFYDSTVAWRDRAMEGVFHSGKLVNDLRSSRRDAL